MRHDTAFSAPRHSDAKAETHSPESSRALDGSRNGQASSTLLRTVAETEDAAAAVGRRALALDATTPCAPLVEALADAWQVVWELEALADRLAAHKREVLRRHAREDDGDHQELNDVLIEARLAAAEAGGARQVMDALTARAAGAHVRRHSLIVVSGVTSNGGDGLRADGTPCD